MFARKFKPILVGLSVLLILTLWFSPVSLFRAEEPSFPSAQAGFFDDDLELFQEVVDLVADKYVYPPDYRKMYAGAIKQMIQSTGLDTLNVGKTPHHQFIAGKSYRIQYDLNYDPKHDLASLKKVYHFLLDETRGRLSKSELEISGIIGLMNSLDPYSQFLDKNAFDKSMRDTEGKYGGLGMVVTMKDKHLLVVKTMRNAPADRAGILPDDEFVRVNGQDVRSMEIHELAEMLRGYPNTKVTLTLLRPGDGRERTYTLTREIISIETIQYKRMANRVGYIRISSFSKQTNEQLKDALTRAKRDRVKAFILDLRDNPGGLLNQSVKVASHFLFRGRLIVYTQGRHKSDYKEYRAQYKNSLLHMPVVVLINRHSASASEIVAGALRESGKALIIGENSYGKGSVQTIFRISDGSGLRLTTSKYYTPSGIDINQHGIVPEIKIVKDSASGEGEPPGAGEPGRETAPSIQLKESELFKFLEENGTQLNPEDKDPGRLFAHLLLKNVTVANKKQTLAKAREIAANIHY